MSPTLVIQTAFLGDVVLTLPLIQQLAATFGPVDLVVTPAAAPLLAGQPSVRRVISFDKRGSDRGLRGLRRIARVLRAAGYARAFTPHRSLRSALLARMAGIPERRGFAGGIAGRLHTHRVTRPTVGHESERLGALASRPVAVPVPWIQVSERDREVVRAWLAAHGLEEFIVLAPGAAWATKRWPHYRELAASLPHPIIVIGGPEDRIIAEAIAGGAPHRVHSTAGELTLMQSAALMSLAQLVVCNDSVALHLAGALARPVIAVVGPTGPAPGFGPLGSDGRVIAHPDLACRPCSPHGHARCPLGHHRCMRELSSDRVIDAVFASLESNAERGTRNRRQ